MRAIGAIGPQPKIRGATHPQAFEFLRQRNELSFAFLRHFVGSIYEVKHKKCHRASEKKCIAKKCIRNRSTVGSCPDLP